MALDEPGTFSLIAAELFKAGNWGWFYWDFVLIFFAFSFFFTTAKCHFRRLPCLSAVEHVDLSPVAVYESSEIFEV